MANVNVRTRTNYFETTDPSALRALLASAKTDSGPVVLCDLDGKYMFYCEGAIEGVMTEEAEANMALDPYWADDHPDEAWSLDGFLDRLSRLVEPRDACIVKQVGFESMHCVFAGAHIVTHNDVREYVDLDDVLIEQARCALDNALWKTRMDG